MSSGLSLVLLSSIFALASGASLNYARIPIQNNTPALSTRQSCGTAIDELVGYAAGTTGGGDGEGITATSCSTLESAVKAGGVIKISGTLSGCGIIDLKSDTTVIGVGENSGMQHQPIHSFLTLGSKNLSCEALSNPLSNHKY